MGDNTPSRCPFQDSGNPSEQICEDLLRSHTMANISVIRIPMDTFDVPMDTFDSSRRVYFVHQGAARGEIRDACQSRSQNRS